MKESCYLVVWWVCQTPQVALFDHLESANAAKNGLSSAARIGTATHALPAVQGSDHLRLLRLEPARRGDGNRPVPGWARREARPRLAESARPLEGRGEARDQVESFHDGSSDRIAPEGGPCDR